MPEKTRKAGKTLITSYVCDVCDDGEMRLIQNWSSLKQAGKYYYECTLCLHPMWADKVYDVISHD